MTATFDRWMNLGCAARAEESRDPFDAADWATEVVNSDLTHDQLYETSPKAFVSLDFAFYTALLLALKCSEKTEIEDEIRLTCKLGGGRRGGRQAVGEADPGVRVNGGAVRDDAAHHYFHEAAEEDPLDL